MSDQVPFGAESFAENPEPRVPCVLILDTSGSMEGERIDLLNEGVAFCKSELLADSLAAKRVELAVVTFGGAVDLLIDFATVDRFTPPQLTAEGDTPMGAAIERAIDLVAERKKTYKDHGVAYYRPWLFLITDGAPTDRWEGASMRIQEAEGKKQFMFFSVGVEGADFSVLKRLSREREPLKLKGLRFRDLFQWLSSSLNAVSHSNRGESVAVKAPTGWGEIPGGD